jgi:hypothetical protein
MDELELKGNPPDLFFFCFLTIIVVPVTFVWVLYKIFS